MNGSVKDEQAPPATSTGGETTDARQHGEQTQPRGDPATESIPGMVRRLSRELLESNPPEGFVAATSEIASTVFAQRRRSQEAVGRRSSSRGDTRPTSAPGAGSEETAVVPVDSKSKPALLVHTEPFDNGYHFPPKYPPGESIKMALRDFWKFFTTPMGFFWTIYGLNVVAWGGMLFLLLCNASPAMCAPTCDDIDSPRRVWIEWDSQILTALFCVPAFGFAPWRFRDLWYSVLYRVKGDHLRLRQLAGIHRGWFRLKGSEDLPVDIGPDNIPDGAPKECLALPESKTPDAPLTGTRAPPTAVWKMDFVIWCMVLNTFAQCGLCGVMWGMNRYDRPSWTTGFLVAIACIIAMVGGFVMFLEGKKVKSIEGVPCTERDLEKLASDKEQNIHHYNNIKDKRPKKKAEDVEAGSKEAKS